MSDSLPPPSAPPPTPASRPEQSSGPQQPLPPPLQQSQRPPRQFPNVDSLPTSADLLAAREQRKRDPQPRPVDRHGYFFPRLGLVVLPPPKYARPPGQTNAAVDDTNSAASSSTSSPSSAQPDHTHRHTHTHTHAHASPPSHPSQPAPADQPNMPPPARPVPVPARQKPATPPGPEKCLTWCSQRDGANAMCRMLCLRRRAPLPNQAEALARLRPGMRRDGDDAAAQDMAPRRPRFFTSPAQVYAAHKKDEEAAAAKAAAQEEGASSWSGWSPFEALRNRVAPYSLIFVKGTPDGVVGRYMEELDGDDGQYDFGPISRHAPVTIRRKSTGNMEWLEWGDAGYILHLPLTSLFGPVINLPANAHRVLDPPLRLISRYAASFTDGTQQRGIERLAQEVRRGGAVDMLGQIGKFYQRKAEKAKAKEAEMAERERVQQEQAAQAAQAAQGGIRKEKDKGGE